MDPEARKSAAAWTCLLALGLILFVPGCNTDGERSARKDQAKPAPPPNPAEMAKVEAELRKAQAAIQRTKEVAADLDSLMPVYRKGVVFQRETSPDVDVVLSGTAGGRKRSDMEKVQPAIFHMTQVVHQNSEIYQNAKARIRDHEGRTHQETDPSVNQLLDLYGVAIQDSLDCTELLQQLPRAEWWCRQDRDFQKYVDRYFLHLNESTGDNCFSTRDAVRIVCGAAYSVTAKANTLYRTE